MRFASTESLPSGCFGAEPPRCPQCSVRVKKIGTYEHLYLVENVVTKAKME